MLDLCCLIIIILKVTDNLEIKSMGPDIYVS